MRHRLRRRYGHTSGHLTREAFDAQVERALTRVFGAAHARRLMGEYRAKIHASYAVRLSVVSVVRDIKLYERGG